MRSFLNVLKIIGRILLLIVAHFFLFFLVYILFLLLGDVTEGMVIVGIIFHALLILGGIPDILEED